MRFKQVSFPRNVEGELSGSGHRFEGRNGGLSAAVQVPRKGRVWHAHISKLAISLKLSNFVFMVSQYAVLKTFVGFGYLPIQILNCYPVLWNLGPK